MFGTLISVIKNSFLPETRIALGRWNRVYTASLLNTKVDLSNEDHCGPCGQYRIERSKITVPEKKIDLNLQKL